MVRRMAAVVLALILNPALARAQDTVLTVTVLSADVHRGPSTATPVIGHVSRGSVLPISRNLGSWAKVAWTDAPEGIGYVHVTMGRLGPSNAASAANLPARTSSATASATFAPASATTIVPPVTRKPASDRMAVRGELSNTPITHIFGVGGLVGPMRSFGATARVWRTDHLGIQLAFTRDAMTSDLAAGRVTSIRVEPGLVYGLFDRVTDYVWFRPYVGSVLSVRHQTWKLSGPTAVEPASDNGIGFRLFGGSELTFAGVPRLGLSVEFGYRRFPTTPFPEFEADRLSVSIAGHWYVR